MSRTNIPDEAYPVPNRHYEWESSEEWIGSLVVIAYPDQ